MSFTEEMFAPLKALSLIGRFKQWRSEVRERQRLELEKEQHEREQRDAEWCEMNRLRPVVRGEGIILPISGDMVVRKSVTGIAVKGSSVIVSTAGEKYYITCASHDEAATVRDNIVKDGGFLQANTISYP